MIGIGMNVQRIQRWMTAVVFGPCAPAGVIEFALLHIGVDEGQHLIRRWKVEQTPDRDEFQELIDAIDSEAAEDATQMGMGAQRYALAATSAEGQEQGTLTLRYLPSQLLPGEPASLMDSEPATHRGLAAMAMRHADAAYRMLAAMIMGMQSSTDKRIAMQDRTIEKLMQFQIDKVELMDNLSGKQLEREILAETKRKESEVELHREVAKIDRDQMLLRMGEERVAPLIPLLADHFLGRKAGPQQATSRDEMLAAFLDSLSAEQAAVMQSNLRPDQLANLMRLAEQLQSVRKPVNAGAQRAPRASKISDDTAVLALKRIKEDLLPWAAAQLKEGKPLEPPHEIEVAAKILRLFIPALSVEQFNELTTKDGPFDAEERKVLLKLVEEFKLSPNGGRRAATRGGAAPLSGPVPS
jgi:hypothetical protein